jgi:Bacterial SH3 domain
MTTSVATKHTARCAGSALAITTLVLMAGPAPAQAAPCNNWQFYTDVGIHEVSTDFSLVFTPGPGKTSVAGAAVNAQDHNHKPFHGTAKADIANGHLTVSVNWDNGTYQNFFGEVTDENHANGRTQSDHPDLSGIAWEVYNTAFKCGDRPAPQGPIAAPGDTTASAPSPKVTTPPAPATVKVKGDVDIYTSPGGKGKPVGVLRQGTQVQVLERRTDNWVHVSSPDMSGGSGWVWGDYIPS